MSVPAPMLATAGRPPADAGQWAIEMKWDGMRTICRTRGEHVEFYSRNRNNVTACFPELGPALTELTERRDLILDGEIIAPDPATGAPSFARLQQRMHLQRPSLELRRAVPVQLFIFDVLDIDGANTMALPYTERRARLTDLELSGPAVQTPPYWTGIPVDTMLATAADHGLEGILSKRLDSSYRPGTRSRLWLKTPLRRSADVIIAGWVASSSGGEPGALASLVLGAYDRTGRLVYVGHVGTGFSAAARRALRRRLTELAVTESPFDRSPPGDRASGVHWVQPRLVGTVEYREYVGALRHPSWRGLRVEIDPVTVGLPD
ncbi:non-homologous end-joining DNA ligase [Nocardia amikacinitolerans]|uniref:non-homologous end-joining DNA ligase n=1 Tax=Nocardia amikacinitolerans TaxID=756689 RepID=UPI0036A0891D